MQYHFKPTAVNATATAAPPRVVDAHGLLHLRATKAARACLAADAVDGVTILGNPTLKLVAEAYGVSIGTVGRALRLTPEQRQAVRQGKRPLVLPSAAPAPPVISSMTMGARERLKEIINEIGLDATLNLLAASERVAA